MCICNATQRNAYQNYILNNNFKFYISQFIFFYKRIQNSCSFLITKKNQKITSFCQKEAKTTPFRIRNSLVKTFSQYLESPSLRGFAEAIYINWIATPTSRLAHAVRLTAMTMKNKLAILNNKVASAPCVNNSGKVFQRKCTQWVKTHCYKKWIASLIPFVRNDSAFFRHYELKRSNLFINKLNYAFSCALKNQFEIISQLNYGFCYKNCFFNLNQVFRNSYDFGRDFDFGRNLNYGFGKDYNRNFKKNCDYDFEKNCNFGFGKNYFGNCNFGYGFGNEICSIGNNFAGFLFNRKILKTKI